MQSRSNAPISYRSRQRTGLTSRPSASSYVSGYNPSTMSKAMMVGSQASPAVSALGTGLAASTDTAKNTTTTPLEKYLSEPDSVVMDEGLQAGAMIGNAPKGITAETSARDALVDTLSTPTIADIGKNFLGVLGLVGSNVSTNALANPEVASVIANQPVEAAKSVTTSALPALSVFGLMNTIAGTPLAAKNARDALDIYTDEEIDQYSELTNKFENMEDVRENPLSMEMSQL